MFIGFLGVLTNVTMAISSDFDFIQSSGMTEYLRLGVDERARDFNVFRLIP